MEVISYVDAKAKGLKRYFTGKPCKNGHLSERFVSHCGCIACAYERTNEWGKTNGPRKYALHKRFMDKNPTYKAKWAKENPEARRRSTQNWYRANAEQEIKRALAWAKNNPERSRVNVRNRTARRKKASGSHTADQIKQMLDRQNWKCVACGISIKKKRHIDHIVPLVRGGSNDIGNLQGLCPSCNCSKNAKDPIEWAREIGRLL